MRKTGRKFLFKSGKVLCLILAMFLVIGTMPLSGALENAESGDSAIEVTPVQEVMSEPEQTAESFASPEPEADTQSPEVTLTPGMTTEASEEPSATPEEFEETEEMAYANSISGMLWLDMFDDTDNSIYAGDGICQPEEEPLAGYMVYLYKADDTSAAVQAAETDGNGRYEFTDLEPRSYIVGVPTTTMGGIEYLLPFFYLDGTEEDNRFVAAYDADADAYLYAYTAPIVVDADTVITDMNAGMRTPSEISPMTLIPWGAGEVIVENEVDFRAALGNSAYTTIYLGADIPMQSSAIATVAARTGTTLVINGTDPRDGTRHTYTDFASAVNGASLQGPCTNITFKNIDVYINTYFGIYYPTVSGGAVTFDGVTGQAAQFYYGFNYTSTLIIKDSVLTLTRTHTYVSELVQNVGTVRFEENVTVTRDSTYPTVDEFFYLTGASSTVEIAAGANVLLDNRSNTNDGDIFYGVGSFIVGQGAQFTCYSASGFCDAGTPMTAVTIGAGADVRFIQTGPTHTYSSLYGIDGTSTFTAEAGSKFLLYDNEADSAWGSLWFANIILNNPESFVVLNPSGRAIGNRVYSCSLNATGVSSIRYYQTAAISGLFNTTTHVYTPSSSYLRWWAQSVPFNVHMISWASAAAPTIIRQLKLDNRIKAFKFNARIGGGELPVNTFLAGITNCLPSR